MKLAGGVGGKGAELEELLLLVGVAVAARGAVPV